MTQCHSLSTLSFEHTRPDTCSKRSNNLSNRSTLPIITSFTQFFLHLMSAASRCNYSDTIDYPQLYKFTLSNLIDLDNLSEAMWSKNYLKISASLSLLSFCSTHSTSMMIGLSCVLVLPSSFLECRACKMD